MKEEVKEKIKEKILYHSLYIISSLFYPLIKNKTKKTGGADNHSAPPQVLTTVLTIVLTTVYK